jgi:hypothetical protein
MVRFLGLRCQGYQPWRFEIEWDSNSSARLINNNQPG